MKYIKWIFFDLGSTLVDEARYKVSDLKGLLHPQMFPMIMFTKQHSIFISKIKKGILRPYDF